MMTLEQLILVCALGAQTDEARQWMWRVVMTTSQGEALLVLNASTGERAHPRRVEEAVRISQAWARSGATVHVGLAGVSLDAWQQTRRPLAEAFDVCPHLGVASLLWHERAGARMARGEDARHRALTRYWDGERTGPPSAYALMWGAAVLAQPKLAPGVPQPTYARRPGRVVHVAAQQHKEASGGRQLVVSLVAPPSPSQPSSPSDSSSPSPSTTPSSNSTTSSNPVTATSSPDRAAPARREEER